MTSFPSPKLSEVENLASTYCTLQLSSCSRYYLFRTTARFRISFLHTLDKSEVPVFAPTLLKTKARFEI